jgi:hypothetical protein
MDQRIAVVSVSKVKRLPESVRCGAFRGTIQFMPFAGTIASRAEKNRVAAPRDDLHCTRSSSFYIITVQLQRQLTRVRHRGPADRYSTIPQ